MYLSPFTILLLLLEGKESSTGSPLQILHEFIVPKFININNNSDGVNSFNGTNVAIVDVDYWKDKGSAEGKIFITTPRQKPGTIASLSTIVKENSESVLSPYPSAEANLPTCNNIVSAFRTQADSCNRLWVIDTGVVDSALEDSKRICPSKVLIYDLKTDKLISKHEVPDKILKPDSLLTTIVTDIRGNQCENAFAYIADVQGYQIIVFDLKNETFWQFHNKYHYPDPTEGTFNINGVTFDLMDGILGLALGPVIKGDRTLFFHSVASRRESWVQTSVLQNRSLAGDLNSASEYFKTSTGTRSSKSAAESMDKYGVLFFGLLEENTLACWPSWVPYRSTNIKKLVKALPINNLTSNLQQKDKAVHHALELLSQAEAEEAVMEHEAEKQHYLIRHAKDQYEKYTGEKIFQIEEARRFSVKAKQALKKLMEAQEVLRCYDKKIYEAKMKSHNFTQNLIELKDELTNAQIEFLLQNNAYPIEASLFNTHRVLLNDCKKNLLGHPCQRGNITKPPFFRFTSSKQKAQKCEISQNNFTTKPLLTISLLRDFKDTNLEKNFKNPEKPLQPLVSIAQQPLYQDHITVTEAKKTYDVIPSIFHNKFINNFVVPRIPLQPLVSFVHVPLYPDQRAKTAIKKRHIFSPYTYTIYHN